MRLLYALAMVGLSLAPSGSAQQRQGPQRLNPPLPVDKDWEPHSYRGRVVTVTGEAVTIKPEGFLRIDEISFHADGTVKEERFYIQDNTKPPRTFAFSDFSLWVNGTLPAAKRAGKPPLAVGPTLGQHKIADLQPGDLVLIRCSRVEGVDYCYEIQIHRRPGGQVPPAIGDDKLPVDTRVATLRNAEQQREELAVRGASRLFLRFRP